MTRNGLGHRRLSAEMRETKSSSRTRHRPVFAWMILVRQRHLRHAAISRDAWPLAAPHFSASGQLSCTPKTPSLTPLLTVLMLIINPP